MFCLALKRSLDLFLWQWSPAYCSVWMLWERKHGPVSLMSLDGNTDIGVWVETQRALVAADPGTKLFAPCPCSAGWPQCTVRFLGPGVMSFKM